MLECTVHNVLLTIYFKFHKNALRFKVDVNMITLTAQVLCGTEPHPVRFRAKKYKVQEKSFDLVQFRLMMSHLPEHVSDAEIEEMFSFADKNNDGRISWDEFLVSA